MLVLLSANFLLNLGCITYVRYDLSIHEILPFEFFIFLIFNKMKKKGNNEKKKKKINNQKKE